LTIVLLLLSALAVAVAVPLSHNLFLGGMALMGTAVVVGVILRTDLATLIFTFALYANIPVVAKRFHGVPSAVAASAFGLLLIPAFLYLVLERRRVLLGWAFPAVLAFFVVQLVSTLQADRKDEAVAVLFVSVTEGVLLYLLVHNAVRTRELLRHVTWMLILAGAFMGGLGITQRVTGTYWRDYKGFAQMSEPDRNAYGEIVGRRWACGPIGEKNYYAQFMLMLLPLAFFRIYHERRLVLRAAGLIAAICILGAIGLTASRGAAVGLAAILAVMALLRSVSLRHVGAILAGATFLVLLFPGYRERLMNTAKVFQKAKGAKSVQYTDIAVQGRITEMAAALLVFREHPVLGVGPGNFPFHFVREAGRLGFQVHSERRLAHCAYLEIAAETGLLGLVCFLGIIGVTAQQLYQARTLAQDREMRGLVDGLLLSQVGMVVTSVFLSFAFIRYHWFMFALSASAVWITHVNAKDSAASSVSGVVSPQ
jgi:hypothetical protein